MESQTHIIARKLYGYLKNRNLPKISSTIIEPSFRVNSGKFFPVNISQYIENNTLYVIKYTSVLSDGDTDINIAVFVSVFEEEDTIRYDEYIERMLKWLKICFSIGCRVENLNIFFYPTHFKKKLPDNKGTTIGVEHVNSAFTTRCERNSEIILYREEEWFKVFVHETFHTFGLETDHQYDQRMEKVINRIFVLDEKILFSETYAEVWARVVNICFYCYPYSTNVESFICTFKAFLRKESEFSQTQTNKILNFMNLDYNNLCNKSIVDLSKKKMYKEDSNVFSYYILTSIIIRNIDMFFDICSIHNTGIFNCNSDSYNDMKRLLEENFNFVPTNSVTINKKTTRMSWTNWM